MNRQLCYYVVATVKIGPYSTDIFFEMSSIVTFPMIVSIFKHSLLLCYFHFAMKNLSWLVRDGKNLIVCQSS